MFRLKADNHYDVRFILNRMLEMMNDTSTLAHARRGDDDTGSAHGIKPLAVLRRGDKMDVAGGEDIATGRESLQGFVVIAFRVPLEHVRGLIGQR